MTDEQQLQREMFAEEQFYRDLFRVAPDAEFTVDRNRLIERVNDQAIILTEYARTELVGHPVLMLVPGWKSDHDADVDKTFERPSTRQMGMAEKIKTAIITKMQREIPVTIFYAPVVHEVKGLLMLVVVRRRDG